MTELSSSLAVAVITTVNHNVGDDFVREGVLHLLKAALPETGSEGQVKAELIHKHSPVTAVYGLESVRSLRMSRMMEPVARVLRLTDRIAAADLLIQSGAPVYWCHPERFALRRQ